MRVVGIDPGTYSFDLFGMESNKMENKMESEIKNKMENRMENKTIVDESIRSEKIFKDPGILIKKIKELMPLDIVIGPSGYGIPLKSIKNLSEEDIGRMIPLDTNVPVNEGIKNVLLKMKDMQMPVYFTPGVIDLKTVPAYRKWNRFDMGTADKVCCVALGIKDQSERLKIPFNKTSFVYVEVGYGFTAVLGVENGKIVDGIGGTNGSPGFLACGGMDAEVAIRLKLLLTQDLIFKGGLKDFVGEDIEPRDLAEFKEAMLLLGESIERDVASMLVSVRNPKEILLSGRLMTYDPIKNEITHRLNKYAKVVQVNRLSKIAKEAACGAYVIGEGLLGGKYHKLVENLEIVES